MSDKYSKRRAIYTWVFYFVILSVACSVAAKIGLLCEGQVICWAPSVRNEALEPWQLLVMAIIAAGLLSSMIIAVIYAGRKS